MLRYAARRVALLLVVVLLVTFGVFTFTTLVRDPAYAILGDTATKEQVEAIHLKLGLNRPVYVQYADWLTRILQGDFGGSVRTGAPVGEAIWDRIGPTAELTFLAILLAVVLGVSGGVAAAIRSGGWVDYTVSTASLVGVAMPSFWFGLLMILLFAVHLDWLPPSGYVSLLEEPLRNLKLMILPALTLSLETLAVVLRLTRTSVLEALREPHVLAARARGVPNRTVVFRYGLRSGLIPVVTFIGVRLGRLFGGAIVVETLFGIPGIGRLAVDAMYNADRPVILGVVMLMVVAVGIANVVVDILYGLVDPRVKLS